MKILVVLLSSFLIHATAEANCPPWQPCRKGRISGDGGYGGAVAAATAQAEALQAPTMRFENLDTPEPTPSRGAVHGGISPNGSNSPVIPSTSGLAVMEFDRQSSVGRPFESNQSSGSAQFRQGGGTGGAAGAGGGNVFSGSGITGNTGLAGAVAVATTTAGARQAPAMRFENLQSSQRTPSWGAAKGGSSQSGSDTLIIPSTSGLAVMEFDVQSSDGRPFESKQTSGSGQFSQGGGIGGEGDVAGIDGGDGPSGSGTTGNTGLASLHAISTNGYSGQWSWTGRLVTGKQAQVVKDLVFKRYLDGKFRSDAIRVNYWQILGEAVDLAKSQVSVVDSLDAWKTRFQLSNDDESIWNVLYAAGAVSKRQ